MSRRKKKEDNTMLYIGGFVTACVVGYLVYNKYYKSESTTGASTSSKVDCVMNEWSAWSTCENGQRKRTRTVKTAAKGGGADCPSDTVQREECTPTNSGGGIDFTPSGSGGTSGQSIPIVNCSGAWGAWEPCTEDSKRTRRYTITQQPSGGGTSCPTTLVETVRDVVACPPPRRDCESTWSNWGECAFDSADNKRYKSRTATITQQPQGGGRECPSLTQREECKAQVVGTFIGGGKMQGPYVDLKVVAIGKSRLKPTDEQYNRARMDQNIGKTIRMWYDPTTKSIVGLGYQDTWVVPSDFGALSIINLGGGFQTSPSFWELFSASGEYQQYKLLLRLIDVNTILNTSPVTIDYAYDAPGIFSNRLVTMTLNVTKGE